MRALLALSICALSSLSSLALAQTQANPHVPAAWDREPDARVTFGGDVLVGPGESVTEVVTMGGDVEVYGEVRGDVVTMGGDVVVHGDVRGDVVTMGGDLDVHGRVWGDVATAGGNVDLHDGGTVAGEVVTSGGVVGHGPAFHVDGAPLRGPRHWLSGPRRFFARVASGAVSFGLLFLLGLLWLGLGRERLRAVQTEIVEEPLASGLLGLVSLFGGLVAIVALCITIIGIPIALVLALLLPLVAYAGLAASASVVGAALPVTGLRGKPVLQLLAGCGVLFVASLVPVAGPVAVGITTLLGVGAIARTRGKTGDSERGEAVPSGPYRTAEV